CQQDYSSPFTF
nr:immunoglobulin light chain junction region [Mus musculus]NSL98776.1 immunoglobulin light chain junction region [Mus musculus]NSL98872.1 immunoglobulin light chain junction region [Mus musculus]NSL98884.1 immunoglobulin light chain junction region [Mus musculus]NSL99594.1 immunoglobulin light chain junction region [Mus musculus]